MAFLVIAVLIVILVKVITNGVGVINLSFLLKAPTEGMTEGGIFPAIFGTVCITVLMIILAIPVGVSAAIYLIEYAGNNFLGRIIRASINNLAGVPSIVFGLFGVGFFRPVCWTWHRQNTGNPLVIRSASYALGSFNAGLVGLACYYCFHRRGVE